MEDIKYDSIKSEIEKSVFIEIDTITGIIGILFFY